MRFTAKLVWSEALGWHVNLPHYDIIPGSFAPITPLLIDADGVLADTDVNDVLALNPTVDVEVPERIMDPDTGRPSKEKIRELYKDDPKYDRDDVTDDV